MSLDTNYHSQSKFSLTIHNLSFDLITSPTMSTFEYFICSSLSYTPTLAFFFCIMLVDRGESL